MKYNEERMKIGEYRVQRLKEEYEAEGYRVVVFPTESNGLDMILMCDEKEWIAGVEVTNWNKKGYLNGDRFENMKVNWDDLKMRQLRKDKDRKEYRKWLVYSYFDNIKNMLTSLEREGVELIEIGYQDLPKKKDEQLKGWCD
jgi:predicted secreted protein